MLPKIVTALGLPDELLDEVTQSLLEMLDLCVHLLSPRGIGATLVWRIVESAVMGDVSNNPSEPPTTLPTSSGPSIDTRSLPCWRRWMGMLRVEAGRVLNYWAMLDPSAEAKKLVAEMGGTRHTSAKRYSYDEPGSIVVVVSEDGPVTIFSDSAQ